MPELYEDLSMTSSRPASYNVYMLFKLFKQIVFGDDSKIFKIDSKWPKLLGKLLENV